VRLGRLSRHGGRHFRWRDRYDRNRRLVFGCSIGPLILKGLSSFPRIWRCAIGYADAACLGKSFQPGRDIHAVAEDVVVVEDDVTDVNADTEFNSSLLAHVDVFERDPSLPPLRRSARHLRRWRTRPQHAVARRLNNPPSMRSDCGVYYRVPESLELGECAFLIPTGNICRQNRR
jgi:hypothetical protein